MRQAVGDPAKYATSFGYSGTYCDYVKEILSEHTDVQTLLNLDISKDAVANILQKAGFASYRFAGALAWIMKTVEMIRSL